MGASPYQQMQEQHIRHLHQSRPVHPPVLAHQRQSPTHSGHNPWESEAALEAHLSHQRQVLAATQDLEPQRLQMLLPDSGANRHP